MRLKWLAPAIAAASFVTAPVAVVAAPVERSSQPGIEENNARGRSTIWIILLLALVAAAVLLAGGGKDDPVSP
jgi:uncharacterized membrane protein